jgi:NADPH-dependent curcumin reductase CurA
MTTERNLQITFADWPQGDPKDSDFALAESDIPSPGPGQMLLQTIYLSLDPALRLRMSKRYHLATLKIGQPISSPGVAVVVKSNLADYQVGDFVLAPCPWANYSLSNGMGMGGRPVRKLDPSRAPLSATLGVLGVPGLTAYVGLLEIGKPEAGQTIVVSGAAGAVGSLVGQIAKIKGCHVVGVAGSAHKCAYVKDELGYDAVVDYRKQGLADALRVACPKGVDIYYENVGGAVFEAVLPQLNEFARIPVCGLVTQYSATEEPSREDKTPLLMRTVLGKRLRIQGFVVSDHFDLFPVFAKEVGGWLREGKIKYREDIAEGLENAPRAFQRLLKSENFGKALVRVSPDPTR